MSETEVAAAILLGDIYVVMAERGEYSDREEWPVAYYFREVDAQSHVHLCNARLREWASHAHDYCEHNDVSSIDIPDAEHEWFFQGYDYGTTVLGMHLAWESDSIRMFYKPVKPGTMMETIRRNRND